MPARRQITRVSGVRSFLFAIFWGKGRERERERERDGVRLPSNILTAVGKSLTLLAARRAAVMTEGEGTRS